MHNTESTLLDCLQKQFPDTPRSRAKEWILAGRVAVNGTVIRRPHHVLADPGDALVLQGRHAATADCGTGWRIHPRVTMLHLDSALVVVNKGAGLLAVPSDGGELSALSIADDFLAGRLKPSDRKLAGKPLPAKYRHLELFPVHRLDQYTTGVFCIAANPVARRHLIEQLKTRTMQREYVAFVEGRPKADAGMWRNWLQLSRDELSQRVLTPEQAKAAGDQAIEATTHYRVASVFEWNGGKQVFAKLHLRLESGRKHQIRVQAAHAGLPLIGDRTYHPDYRTRSSVIPAIDFSRQALHAELLRLEHPDQPGKLLSWTGEFPKDLKDLEALLADKSR